MTKTAVIYARVSDRKQLEKDLSIPSQVEACERLAAEVGAEVVRVFTEEGRSAWKGDRPEFNDAIAYCELQAIDFFIAWDTARFSRNVVEGPAALLRLRTAGTKIIYPTIEIDPDTDAGFIVEHITQIMNEFQSRKISADTVRNMIRNAQRGYSNGGRIPIGYELVDAGDGSRKKRLIPLPLEASVVTEIFELYGHGNGAGSIAAMMNEQGKALRGKKWTTSAILLLLHGESVLGHQVFNRRDSRTGRKRPRENWIVIKTREAIVPLDVWMAAQARLARAADVNNHGSPKSHAVFTGMLKCGHCGASLQKATGTNRYKKRYDYYCCSNWIKHQECDKRRTRSDLLDDHLIREIARVVFTDTALRDVMQDLTAAAAAWSKDRQKLIADLRREHASRIRARTKLYEQIEGDAPVNLGDLAPRLREHNAAILDIERRLSAVADQKPPELKIGPNDLRTLREMLIGTVQQKKDPMKLREFFAGFVDLIELHDDHVMINYSPERIARMGGVVQSSSEWRTSLPVLITKSLRFDLPEKLRRQA